MIIDVFTSTITKPNTVKKYICDVKRVFKLLGIISFAGSLDEYVLIENSIDDSRYSLSTSFQAILVFITNSKIVIDKKVLSNYDKMHEIYIITCEDENIKKRTDKELAVICCFYAGEA